MKKKSKKNVTILHSGGIDSTALIHFYTKLNFNVSSLFVDFGQLAGKEEFKAVKKICSYYGITSNRIIVKSAKSFNKGFIQGRNLFLIATALLGTENVSGQIAIGAHAGTNYIDCSDDFLIKTNDVISLYTNGSIVLSAPFISWKKSEIFSYCKLEGVPLQITYSCENGTKQPCNKCQTCKEIKVLYEAQN